MTLKERFPVTLRRLAKIERARLAEKLGSYKYSMPALNKLDAQMVGRLPARGVFLEVGANDGFSQSNTYFLERALQWTGILIEPQPSLYRICRLIRRSSICFNAACVDDPALKSAVLNRNSNDLMAVTRGLQPLLEERRRMTASRDITVKARTLDAIIRAAGSPVIDFMSIDVEGAEMAVLRGLNWADQSPNFLLVETDYPDAVDALVSKYMVKADQLSFHDYLWVKRPR